MTLLINKDFVCHDIQVTIALPESYDSKKAYPVVFLNDGQLDYLGKLADSAILIGLEPQSRLDDFTPWQAQALRPGSPDFGGKLASYHDHLFGYIFKSIAQEFRLDESRMAYGGYSLGGLAAISSLYSSDKMPFIFSICGSFWYPNFVAYCKAHHLINKTCSVYLRNGLTEGLIIRIDWSKLLVMPKKYMNASKNRACPLMQHLTPTVIMTISKKDMMLFRIG